MRRGRLVANKAFLPLYRVDGGMTSKTMTLGRSPPRCRVVQRFCVCVAAFAEVDLVAGGALLAVEADHQAVAAQPPERRVIGRLLLLMARGALRLLVTEGADVLRAEAVLQVAVFSVDLDPGGVVALRLDGFAEAVVAVGARGVLIDILMILLPRGGEGGVGIPPGGRALTLLVRHQERHDDQKAEPDASFDQKFHVTIARAV